MTPRSNRGRGSSEALLFNICGRNPDQDVCSALYSGLDRATLKELLDLHSSAGLAGSAVADRLSGFNLPESKRLEWPGSEQQLLRLRHQIVLNRLTESELKQHVQQVRQLEKALDIKPLLAEVLVNRGLTNPQEALRYLYPSLSDELGRLPPLSPLFDAAKALYASVRARERIVLYADFDADGNCAAAILRRAIELVGGSCQLVQADRALEGYGMTDKVLPRILKLQPQLLVTLDLGTSDRPQFETLRRLGVRSICVDHHKPQTGNVAEPDIMVNPHLNPSWRGYQELCASGLAWLLAHALFRECWGDGPLVEKYAETLLPFAATGTVADVMQLTGLNRALVSAGTTSMLTSEIPAFQVLCRELRGAAVTGEYLAYTLGPILNAASRINKGSADRPGTFPVAELLNSRELSAAAELLKECVGLNEERKKIERSAVTGPAQAALDQQRKHGVPVHCGTILPLEEVHEGVVGLVAARTTESMQCPTIVVTRDAQGNWKGSGRSIPGIDLFEILESLKSRGLVLRGGGHPAAIGLSVLPEKLQPLSEAFQRAVQERLGAIPPEHPGHPYRPIRWLKEYRPDLIMSVDDVCDRAPELNRIASAIQPSGRSNEPLTILLPRVLLTVTKERSSGDLEILLRDAPNQEKNWMHQGSLAGLSYARSVTAKLLQHTDSSKPLDLIVQPVFDRAQRFTHDSQQPKVKVLFAQPSVFERAEQQRAADKPTARRKRRIAAAVSSPALFDLSIDTAAPSFSSMQEFYDYFGITIMTDAVEFWPEQVEFVASQIIRDRSAPITENLLCRGELASGKTVMALLRAAEVLCRDPKAKVLYLTPQLDLAEQALEDIKKFMTLTPDQVAELTGRGRCSYAERVALLHGPARLVVGTPQTFTPFLPPPDSKPVRSLAAPLAQCSLVIFDEVHLVHGDGHEDGPSQYAYRQIAREVFRLQEAQVAIRLWAQSGTPANTRDECKDLKETLRARYEKVRTRPRLKRQEAAYVPLDSEVRQHLIHLRDAYRLTHAEIVKALASWTNPAGPLDRVSSHHEGLISAFRDFERIIPAKSPKILPPRSKFLASQKRLLDAIGKLTKERFEQRDLSKLFDALSRVAELRVILRYFDSLRSKGRSALVREASRNMLQALYPPKKATPESLTNCHVRACRRPQMRDLLTWAMTETTPQAILLEFRRVYPGDYQGENERRQLQRSRITPCSWRQLLGVSPSLSDEEAPFTKSRRPKEVTPSRLDLLDERLLDQLSRSERLDLKEITLLENLRSLKPDEKVMVMLDQKFEARLLSDRLTLASIPAGWYAGRSVARRLGMRENLEAFRQGVFKVLCSTSAGDMGHNIPRVSRVIRWVPLTSPKRNAQSAGRAGRQEGIEGVYTVLLIADDDKDMDEREMQVIAQARAAAMKRV